MTNSTDSFKRSINWATFVVCLCLIALNLSACGLLKPPPDDTVGVTDWLVIPVFYATNRTYAGTDGSIDYSEVPNGKGLLCGVKNIAVPNPVFSPVEKGTEDRMLWPLVHKDSHSKAGAPDFDRSSCLIHDATLEREAALQALRSYMKKTKSGEAVIFVHGCCATFTTVMQRAARVEAHMQVPVVVYDWVSPRGFTKYLENETLAEQSLDNFCRFLDKAEKIMDPGHITLLGHSLGCLFVDEAMVRRSVRSSWAPSPVPRFRELIMSNADVDAKAYLNHAGECAGNGLKCRLYISRKDSRLNASAIAHGGFKRLGAPGALTSELAQADQGGGGELIDITANDSGHELPFWIVANMHKYGNLGPVKEYELKQESGNYFTLVKTGAAKPQSLNPFFRSPETAEICRCLDVPSP